MALVPVSSIVLDPDTIAFDWGPMNGGDYGAPLNIWAFPHLVFQFTGAGGSGVYPPTHPPTAMDPSRSITVYGSQDGTCWCPINAIGWVSGFEDQLHDTYFHLGENDPRFRYYMPIANGTVSPTGDCGLLLLAYRLFSSRTS